MELAVRRLLAAVLGSVAILTLAGFLLKAPCIGHYNERRDRDLCTNDIQVTYSVRGMHERPFPYIHGGLVDHNLVGGAIEYPVLTGLFAYVPALLVDNDGSYLEVTALLLAPFTFLTAWLLSRMVRWRALLYAAAPPLVWYSFQNWDLLVVCATVGAVYCWSKGRYGWAGVLLAAGTSLKYWPLLLLLPLLLDRWTARDRDGALKSLAGFVGLFALVNVPFIVASPQGWWAPYAFQQERAADITSNSIWFWAFPSLTTADLNTIVPVLVVIGTAIACGYGWRRARAEGVFPFLQVCGAVLAVFIVTNKAHSPQYVLWLLPFFCLIRLRWGWWLAYMAIDACMYVGLFRWYYALSQGRDFGLAKQALIVGVWGRVVMLLLLFVVMLRSQPALVEPLPSADDRLARRDPAPAPS